MDIHDVPLSPRLVRLMDELAGGNLAALEISWQEIAGLGSPLIELLPGNYQDCLVTFLYRSTWEALCEREDLCKRGSTHVEMIYGQSMNKPAPGESITSPLDRTLVELEELLARM